MKTITKKMTFADGSTCIGTAVFRANMDTVPIRWEGNTAALQAVDGDLPHEACGIDFDEWWEGGLLDEDVVQVETTVEGDFDEVFTL